MNTHYEVLIIGGGTAGLTVAAQLATRVDPAGIGIVEPALKVRSRDSDV